MSENKTLKRDECWMTFTEALEQYITYRSVVASTPVDKPQWETAKDMMLEASRHMEALTGDKKCSNS